MVNTSLQVLGWVLGLLAWGATVGMTLSEQWRISDLNGEGEGIVLDSQQRHEGLWSSCSVVPTGQTQCAMFPIEITLSTSVLVGCRSLMIISILSGLIGGLVILLSFKCVAIACQDREQKSLFGKYGGGIYLMCGVCVTVAAAWYMTDTITEITYTDARGNPIRWTTGEGVQITLAAGILWIIASIVVMYSSRRDDSDVIIYGKKKHEAYSEYI